MTAVFFLGVFWKRLNGPGAVTALLAGFALGMAKLGAQIWAGSMAPEAVASLAGPAAWVASFGAINFLLFCVFLFVFCCITLIAVSYLTAPPDPGQITNMTYATVTAEGREEIRESWNKWDVINTCVVLCIILGVYIYFSG
jgi:SSS family solute:Na+ symporter